MIPQESQLSGLLIHLSGDRVGRRFNVPGFGAGFEIALEPSKLQKEGEDPGKGTLFSAFVKLIWFPEFCLHTAVGVSKISKLNPLASFFLLGIVPKSPDSGCQFEGGARKSPHRRWKIAENIGR